MSDRSLVASVLAICAGVLAFGCAGAAPGAKGGERAVVGVSAKPLVLVGRVDEPESVAAVTLSVFAVTDDGGLEPWLVTHDVPLDEEARFSVEVLGGLPDPLVVASESALGLRLAILDVHGTTPQTLVIPELGLESTVETYAYLRSRHAESWLGSQPVAVLRTAITPALAEALAGASQFELVTDVVLVAFEAALDRAEQTLALAPEDCDGIYAAILHEMKGIHARMDMSLLESVSPESATAIESSGRRSLLNAFLAQGIDPDRLAEAYVVILETLAAYSHLAAPPEPEEPAVVIPPRDLEAPGAPVDRVSGLGLLRGAR